MFEDRIKQLEAIKKEKALEIEQIQKAIGEQNQSMHVIKKQEELEFAKLQQLNMKLRMKLDEHNQAVWILEEYEQMAKQESLQVVKSE